LQVSPELLFTANEIEKALKLARAANPGVLGQSLLASAFQATHVKSGAWRD